MTAPSPILPDHAARGVHAAPYGASDSSAGIEIPLCYGPIELEYAALRRTSILLDQPQRGVIEVTGPDRVSYLNRMITQELKTLTPGSARRSFWLNRKGRIDADMRVWAFDDRILLDVDIHAVGRAVDGLSGYIVADDVGIRDISAAVHRLALHGPAASSVLASIIDDPSHRALVESLPQGSCTLANIGGVPVVVAREDSAGEIGLELMAPTDAARSLYNAILDRGGWLAAEAASAGNAAQTAHTPGAERAAARVRPGGWHAFNIARIEAGTPLYNLDFGPDSLPAETGVFEDRVSLTKGCYLGQEIVARMHARGHPKQKLMGIKLTRDIPLPAPGANPSTSPRQPETGSHVQQANAADGTPAIGAITSSALSPMLGQTPVSFAMIKYDLAVAGTQVAVQAEGKPITGEIQPTLRFYTK
jgi:folate-binding protein YgfZ